ncbi:phosphotriesterase [Streptomyces boncukensis]|uniref:Phosphotriesterase n=1 Tax=Streptomyces boncukensis TaxID=2711219 RepID=A0A6G4WZ62_9ACTN|nr:phosphotriesterase [Streptomyces boncukensis]
MTAPAVRTVCGDVPPAGLGVTDAHDHLFLRSASLPGQELDDPAAALAELRAFAGEGGGAVAQWTPWGLGRGRAALPALSRRSGVHVIAATGVHQRAHYAAPERDRMPRDAEALAALFTRELTRGPVRAGMIKVAGSFHGLDAHAERSLTAAALAHRATGAPIGVHLEGGTAALDILDLLCGTHGVPPHRVLLGHLGRAPDLRTHLRAAECGAYLAYDGPSRANHATDWHLFDCLTTLAEAGHTDRLLLGGDTTTARARSADAGGEGPGPPFLLTRIRPRLERELGPDATRAILTANPARAFAAEWATG